jgi:hypothetical protein
VINLDDPDYAEANLAPYIETFAKAAKENGWSGWNMDWETAAPWIPTGVNGNGP